MAPLATTTAFADSVQYPLEHHGKRCPRNDLGFWASQAESFRKINSDLVLIWEGKARNPGTDKRCPDADYVCIATQRVAQSGTHLIHSCGLSSATRFPRRCCDTVTAWCRFTARRDFMPSSSFGTIRGHAANGGSAGTTVAFSTRGAGSCWGWRFSHQLRSLGQA